MTSARKPTALEDVARKPTALEDALLRDCGEPLGPLAQVTRLRKLPRSAGSGMRLPLTSPTGNLTLLIPVIGLSETHTKGHRHSAGKSRGDTVVNSQTVRDAS